MTQDSTNILINFASTPTQSDKLKAFDLFKEDKE